MVVCPGVTIGDDCVIGAGSVVTGTFRQVPLPPAYRAGLSVKLQKRIV